MQEAACLFSWMSRVSSCMADVMPAEISCRAHKDGQYK